MSLFLSALDRRRFLQISVATTLGLAVESPRAFADAKDDPFGGFTLVYLILAVSSAWLVHRLTTAPLQIEEVSDAPTN